MFYGYGNNGSPPKPPGYPPQYGNSQHERSRSRGSSMARGEGYSADYARQEPQGQRLNEAISSAFDEANVSSTHVPPELLSSITAQVTEDVIRRLQSAGLEQTTIPMPQPPTMARSSSNSTNSPTLPARDVYTPPSPQRKSDSTASAAPPPVAPPISRSPEKFEDLRDKGRAPPSRESSDSSLPRPKPTRLPTEDETTLEKIWRPLFDSEGQSTTRLADFLQGLAIHIIQHYEPRHSLVITPKKMAKFYEDVRIPQEIYTWNTIFKGKSEAALSKIYRDLECPHHFVQDRPDGNPYIPALTPVGFQRWMTLLIRAHPDNEFDRLAKAVLNMPINSAEDPSYRFPKEISRRLFPIEGNREAADRFVSAITAGGDIEVPKPTRPEPAVRRSPVPEPKFKPPTVTGAFERERKPYAKTPTPNESAVVEPPSSPAPNPAPSIERERKPYSAQPGGGKIYEGPGNLKPSQKPTRANSTSKVKPISLNAAAAARAVDIPDSRQPQHRPSSTLTGLPRRARSPSFSNDFRRSENDLLGYHGPSASAPADVEADENSRYAREAERRQADWARRQAEEDARGFDSPRERERFDRMADFSSPPAPRRDYEDYYRTAPVSQPTRNAYDYNNPPYPTSGYR
ncbi:MAG: hypothetical protein M1819_001066 [Sarea resinae]|nr:MAG: hypothetical protein M1819_001066 [Sarea resinae]